MALRVCVTGGTGYIGSSVVETFVKAGHSVVALGRSQDRLRQLESLGAEAVACDMEHPSAIIEAAVGADIVVHTAFEGSARGPALERALLDQWLPALQQAGAPRAFLYTSGIWVLGPAPVAVDESAPLAPAAISAWRAPHEALVLAAQAGSLRTAVIRPGIVFGGGQGIVSDLVKQALNGLIRVIGPGTNHWPGVHHRDLAELYLRLAETPDAAGVFHGTDGAEETVNDIAEALADHLAQRPDIRHMPLEEARAKLGPFADALALDQRVVSTRAHALGWQPTVRGASTHVARLLQEYRNEHSR
jgi:nucleoside-diphosphate-sugar epimerase